jgi:L,D-transpeptidase YcfS
VRVLSDVIVPAAALAAALLLPQAHGAPPKARTTAAQPSAPAPLRDGQAEERLLQVLTLASAGQTRQALTLAEQLVREHPNFQLAQLALGDLLLARTSPIATLGNIQPPEGSARAVLQELRAESQRRVAAQKARHQPAPGSIPAQLLQLSGNFRHAIAVDASLSRLYLLENSAQGVRLVADYYASVGKLGIDKTIEGDQRTPLGVYFITSRLDGKALDKFYGAGALPLNYPNPLDVLRGKTGSGIWLHGTPPDQFARAPQATDGCVALANPDLERLLRTVEPRTTPVVIAPQLRWVQPQALEPVRQEFNATLQAWQAAKTSGQLEQLLRFYTSDFRGLKKTTLADWRRQLQAELPRQQGRTLQLKNLSLLHWQDSDNTMVVTFGEVLQGARSGPIKRQYWRHEGAQGWKIFFEGVIG